MKYNGDSDTFDDVGTRIHNANEYMIDDSVVELVINQNWSDEAEQNFNVYQTGAPVELTS